MFSDTWSAGDACARLDIRGVRRIHANEALRNRGAVIGEPAWQPTVRNRSLEIHVRDDDIELELVQDCSSFLAAFRDVNLVSVGAQNLLE